jgi:ubiquinone/menaquinone biosynthesis C-methylase UbiE
MSRFPKSNLAARLQKIISYRREASGLDREIASRLPLENTPRVRDIGTGTGLQLRAVHDCNSRAILFGLDLSPLAIELAQKVLGDLSVDLRVGSFACTDYQADFFDVITCNASLSYWDEPRVCLDELYRILKPGGQALLFEPHRDIDIQGAFDSIRENMADRGPLLRWGAV